MRIFSSSDREWSDEDLLAKYRKSGKLTWLGQLYDRHITLVYGLCLKYLKDRDESQDAVMNIFESLIDKLKDQEVTYFKSWLYVVARNHCLMELRKRKPHDQINNDFVENEIALHLNSEETDVEGDEQALRDCISSLKKEQQECVELFYLQQKSYQEITLITPFNLKEVKSYIQNGKRNLKICLEGKNVKR